MFIQTEETPNPLSLKFIADGQIFSNQGNFQFNNQKQAASKSPLAMQLFEIKGIDAIFISQNFITITKNAVTNWQEIKTEIIATIIDFFSANRPILFENIAKEEKILSNQNSSSNFSQEDQIESEIVQQIKELIEIKVRPSVAMDGGDIVFVSFEDGIVKLQLKGACSGCPSSTITLKNGIEQMLKHYVPEVVAVEQVFEEE
jgi:Fe-S cluster biogenesis protein NfuA